MLKAIKKNMDTIKIETVVKPIAKHFWHRFNEIEKKYSKDNVIINKTCRRIDDLAEILDTEMMREKAKLSAEFNRLPKWLQIYIGNSHETDFE